MKARFVLGLMLLFVTVSVTFSQEEAEGSPAGAAGGENEAASANLVESGEAVAEGEAQPRLLLATCHGSRNPATF